MHAHRFLPATSMIETSRKTANILLAAAKNAKE
jgi:hypothetical protein